MMAGVPDRSCLFRRETFGSLSKGKREIFKHAQTKQGTGRKSAADLVVRGTADGGGGKGRSLVYFHGSIYGSSVPNGVHYALVITPHMSGAGGAQGPLRE